MRRVLRLVLGWLSLAVGVAGLVLPILQGWLLIALGAVLLAPDVPVFARLIHRLEGRFPLVRKSTERLRRSVDVELRRRR